MAAKSIRGVQKKVSGCEEGFVALKNIKLSIIKHLKKKKKGIRTKAGKEKRQQGKRVNCIAQSLQCKSYNGKKKDN